MSYISASRVYHPGHLIYTEKPFARVLPRSDRDEHCEFCGKKTEDPTPCSECSIVQYCGVECQANDSCDHGIECENMKKIQGNFYEDFVRLLGRIIFKIKDKDWKTITRNVMGMDISFEDIDSHYEELTRNAKLMLVYKGLKKPLKEFIGKENMPPEEDLLKIIGKVKFSCGNFGMCLPTKFFFGMGKFQHECIPNSNLDIYKNVLKIWAIKKISSSEQITVSHRSILNSDLMRSPIHEDCLEICSCTECSLPYGESVLTKILDEEKAYEVIKFSERIIRDAHILSKLTQGGTSLFQTLLDKALQMHIGVLGPTNALHLKLLAEKINILERRDIQKKMYLIELEKQMRTVFGEFYIELLDVYEALVSACLQSIDNLRSSHLIESAYYLEKMKPLQMHRSIEE